MSAFAKDGAVEAQQGEQGQLSLPNQAAGVKAVT